MKRRRSVPRERSLVRFAEPSSALRGKYPFKRDVTYLFIGEIANMPGHCVVADLKSGRLISGYHTANFRELTDDET